MKLCNVLGEVIGAQHTKTAIVKQDNTTLSHIELSCCHALYSWPSEQPVCYAEYDHRISDTCISHREYDVNTESESPAKPSDHPSKTDEPSKT